MGAPIWSGNATPGPPVVVGAGPGLVVVPAEASPDEPPGAPGAERVGDAAAWNSLIRIGSPAYVFAAGSLPGCSYSDRAAWIPAADSGIAMLPKGRGA
jgi:hypothetical protein